MAAIPILGLIRAGRRARKAFRAWRNLKRIERGIAPKERKVKIDIGTRTSTNAAVGGGLLAQIYIQAVGLLPWPALSAALSTPEAIALAATFFAWAIARISKTADKPGIL